MPQDFELLPRRYRMGGSLSKDAGFDIGDTTMGLENPAYSTAYHYLIRSASPVVESLQIAGRLSYSEERGVHCVINEMQVLVLHGLNHL